MLQTTLQVNGRTIGWIDIARRKDQVDPPPPDAYLTYDYKITITRSGGYDVHDGVLMHRYGDGAWALVALAIDSAGLAPHVERLRTDLTDADRHAGCEAMATEMQDEIERLQEQMAERRRINLKTIEVNQDLIGQRDRLQAENDQLRQWIEDHPLPISPEEQASIDAYEGNGA